MFESDDYDQVLSQFELPEEATNLKLSGVQDDCNSMTSKHINKDVNSCNVILSCEDGKIKAIHNHNTEEEEPHYCHRSPKHMKRKMIHTYFNHKNKRKFPGPAGLLTDNYEENKDETIYEMELLSQDVDFTQNTIRGDLFKSPLWIRLLDDLKQWNLKEVDTINTIKQKTITGSLKRKKAHTVTAFVETIDRSVTDPLIIMRDSTGIIKGTLHRDVWAAFAQYIASDYCAFILWRPTILTTGAAFKKHYLNITLSNILAIYSSTVLDEEMEKKVLPDSYSIVYEVDYTVIKTQKTVQDIGENNILSEHNKDSNDLLDGLDNIFSDDIF